MPRRKKHDPPALTDDDEWMLDRYGRLEDVKVPADVIEIVRDDLAQHELNERQLTALRSHWVRACRLFSDLTYSERIQSSDPRDKLTRETFNELIGTLFDLQKRVDEAAARAQKQGDARLARELRVCAHRHKRTILRLAPTPRGKKPQWATRIAGELARDLSSKTGVLQISLAAAASVAFACMRVNGYKHVEEGAVEAEAAKERDPVEGQWSFFSAQAWLRNDS